MKIQAIIFYILQVLFVSLEAYLAYLLLKYLDRKSLGMQTILDKLVKDTILCGLFDRVIRVFVMGLIVEFARPLEDDVAFFIVTLLHFFSVSRFWIVFSVIIVRYILVFYHTYLNIFDENVTRRIIRCFVCLFSIVIVLADSGNKNSKYYLLKGDESLDIKAVPIFITILGIIIAIVLIVTQYQIEKFKKAVDCQSFDNLETIQKEGQEAEVCLNQMHLNPYRIEIITGLLLGLINGFFQLSLYLWDGNLYINSLRKTLLLQVSTIILILMVIFKNEKIYSFVKHSIQSKLFCQSSKNFHIHNSGNSKTYAIFKPKYEAHDNFNFDKTEEDEIDTQHTDNQLGQHESNDYEFSSIIFVKEYKKQEKDTDSQNIDQASISRNDDDEEDNWKNNVQMPGCSHWSDD